MFDEEGKAKASFYKAVNEKKGRAMIVVSLMERIKERRKILVVLLNQVGET